MTERIGYFIFVRFQWSSLVLKEEERMAQDKLIEELQVMKHIVEGFIVNLKDNYYENSLEEGQTIEERITPQLNELVRGFKKISWNYALRDVKKGDDDNEDDK